MKKVNATLNFVPMEKELLKTWEDEHLFDAIVAKNNLIVPGQILLI